MKSKNIRFILGIMVGVFFMCVFFFFYKNSLTNRNCIPINNKCCTIKFKTDTDSLRFLNTIAEIKDKNNVTNERISVLNSRFNDLYILGGVIVTLLLAIVIGIYVKTESEVEGHIKQNYGKYEEQIQKNVVESQKELAKLIFFVSMAEKSIKSIQSNPKSNPPSPINTEQKDKNIEE